MQLRKLLSVLTLLVLPLAATAQQLTVSAAASLTNAFKEIGPKFEASHPGATVHFNFAGSGVLLQQIAQGAPVDVFASADQKTMDRAAEQKLLDNATRKNFAANSLVLIEPAQEGPALKSLDDLKGSKITRIAVGNVKTVPAGQYTKEALDHAGLWTVLEPKFVPADNVRQALDYVSRGETQAGFVYRTDAALMADKVKIVMTVPGHTAITYPAATIANSTHKALAQDFLNYLAAAPAQEILARYGFSKP